MTDVQSDYYLKGLELIVRAFYVAIQVQPFQLIIVRLYIYTFSRLQRCRPDGVFYSNRKVLIMRFLFSNLLPKIYPIVTIRFVLLLILYFNVLLFLLFYYYYYLASCLKSKLDFRAPNLLDHHLSCLSTALHLTRLGQCVKHQEQ